MNALDVSQLKKTYKDFTFGEVTFSLPQGCILGLLGENGAGKSTLIKLLLGLIRPESGCVSFYGKDLSPNDAAWREDVGVVLDEVGMPGCLTAKEIGRVLAPMYRNWDAATYSALLSRLSVPADRPFEALSRGMKMKLGIAAALAHSPKLLLLDEATNGIDPVSRDDVNDLLSEFTRDETHAVLISSHIVSDLEKICDYVAFLHNGKLVLWEEKDRLQEEYALLHCPREALSDYDRGAIVAETHTPYGAKALVRRDMVPSDAPLSPVSLEELFVLLVKGGTRA